MYGSKFKYFLGCLLFAFSLVWVPSPAPAFADVVCTSSDAEMVGPGFEDVADDQPESPNSPVLGSVTALFDAPALLSARSGSYVNCVLYDVTINSVQYVCLLPSDSESKLMVDSDGQLWNMSSSTVSGRLFTDSFDPTQDTGLMIYLTPCLGNNFSANRNYGSPNYMRKYYWTNNSYGERLTYDDTYCTVHVDKTYHLFFTQDMLTYVVIFLVGCCLICLWKRSAR